MTPEDGKDLDEDQVAKLAEITATLEAGGAAGGVGVFGGAPGVGGPGGPGIFGGGTSGSGGSSPTAENKSTRRTDWACAIWKRRATSHTPQPRR